MWDSASREPPIMEAMRCMVPRQTGTVDREPRAIGSGDEAVERFARGRRAGPLDDEQQDDARSEAFLARRTLGERLGRTEEGRLEVVGWRVGNPFAADAASRLHPEQNLRDRRSRKKK